MREVRVEHVGPLLAVCARQHAEMATHARLAQHPVAGVADAVVARDEDAVYSRCIAPNASFGHDDGANAWSRGCHLSMDPRLGDREPGEGAVEHNDRPGAAVSCRRRMREYVRH
jgi:hypothetical protein